MNTRLEPGRTLIRVLTTISAIVTALIGIYCVVFFPLLFVAVIAAPTDRSGLLAHWLVLPGLGLCASGLAWFRGWARLKGGEWNTDSLGLRVDVGILLLPIGLLLLAPFFYPSLSGSAPTATTPSVEVPRPVTPMPPVDARAAAPAADSIPRPSVTEDQTLARREWIQDCVRSTFSAWQEQQNPQPDTQTQAAKIHSVRSDCESSHPLEPQPRH